MKHLIILVTICLLSLSSLAQEALQPGFAMLETGRFAEAAVFFRNYLQTDSTNRTALLCYGRAVGLSGDVPAAKAIFDRLTRRYPGDYEIELNAAEALMWGKEFAAAKIAYAALLQREAGSFPANLGYGNAFASLQQYDSAMIYIGRALDLQPGNANAMVSRKYTRLGLADQLVKQQQYQRAAPLLDSNLADFTDDPESLYAKGQLLLQQKQYAAALQVYNHMTEAGKDVVNAWLAKSYIRFLQKKKQTALDYANKAVGLADTGQYLKARLGRISALGWNEQFRQAFLELDSLSLRYPGHPDITLKRATLLAWEKNYGRSLALFKSVLLQVPTSFDAHLGAADVLFAQELDDASKAFVRATLLHYPGQKDARDFLERIALRHAPTITTHEFYSWDKGGNESYNAQVGGAFDVLPRLRLSLDYKTRQARDKATDTRAGNDNYTIGARWRIKPFWLAKGALNYAVLRGAQDNSYLQTDVSTEFLFARWHTLELKYRSDVQNFTAGLINSDIRMNNYIATYNLSTPVKIGLYAQYYFTDYSDDNYRHLLFASLYYNLLTDPVIKAGINVNYLSFQQQVPQKYFSPARFKSYEVFLTSENLEIPGKKWLYQGLAAAGVQQIDQESSQFIYRFSVSLGYRPVNNFEVTAYFLHSNSASSTVTGYTYSEAGLRGKWILKRLYDRHE